MKSKILVFTRAPQAGQAKTRLIPALGAAAAAELHAALVDNTLTMLSAVKGAAIELWCTPDTRHPFFQRCAERYSIRLQLQQGQDLGERMQHAFCQALSDVEAAVLIGTDCPDLAAQDVRQALHVLSQGQDAVLTPALDGGYVLIGLRRPRAGLFRDIPWGSDRVLALTRTRLQEAGLRWSELAPKQDIDRPQDLEHVPAGILKRDAHITANG